MPLRLYALITVWSEEHLESLLERAALEGPIMIAIDDLHWADSGTAAALRTPPIRLSGLPNRLGLRAAPVCWFDAGHVGTR